VSHPTTFAGSLFEKFCRGCAWSLSDETDWAKVDTIEVLTGPLDVVRDFAGVGAVLLITTWRPVRTTH